MPISHWIRSNDFLNIGSGFSGEKCFPFLLPFERAIGRMRRHHFLDFIWIYISTSWDFTAKAAVLCQLREDWNIKHHKNKNMNRNQIIFVKLCLFWRWGSFIEKELTEQNHILPSVTYLDLNWFDDCLIQNWMKYFAEFVWTAMTGTVVSVLAIWGELLWIIGQALMVTHGPFTECGSLIKFYMKVLAAPQNGTKCWKRLQKAIWKEILDTD